MSRYPHLAAAAAKELAVRQSTYPALVEQGKVAKEEADGDIRAWSVLAAIFADDGAKTSLSWSELHLFTSRALQSLKAKVEAAQVAAATAAETDKAAETAERLAALQERRACVEAIHQCIDRHKFLIDDTTALLRQRAERSAERAVA